MKAPRDVVHALGVTMCDSEGKCTARCNGLTEAIERARADGAVVGVAETLARHGSPHMSAARDLGVSRAVMATALTEYTR